MSKYFSVTQRQWIKGLVLTMVGTILGALLQLLQNGLAISWKAIAMYGVVAGLSYIVHALGVDTSTGQETSGKFLGKL